MQTAECGLENTLEECRWLYNHLLEKRKTAFEQADKSLSLYQQQETFSILKAGRPTLQSVHSQVLQNVAVRVKGEPERLPESAGQVGIDVGLKTFATLSTTEEIENPRFFRKEEKALARVQRKQSKLAKGTPERRKHRKAVARVHERIAFRRDNFTHQESRRIVDRFGVICVEDLQVNRMIHNHCLAKSIADASWSEFFSKLSCKAEEAGRKYIAVAPAYTSQDCSRCHHRQYMPLSERVYHCPCCLLSIDRDLNAARNICAVGLHSLGLSLEAPWL
jgi:putative transposase